LIGDEETIRGFSGMSLLIIDDAALVMNDLYCAVRPMLITASLNAQRNLNNVRLACCCGLRRRQDQAVVPDFLDWHVRGPRADEDPTLRRRERSSGERRVPRI
jgi:hypothetical protein